ncbi:MAG TPA: hypothetical protein VFU49_05380 [Ktedonobacteraceae bacterium]|nr:hypothetical protein [Ktedonobacteraceae bacterium]
MKGINNETVMDMPPDDEQAQEAYHTFQVGHTAIRVGDEQFQRGYRQGYDDYSEWWAKRQLSDGLVSLFLDMTIIRTTTPNRQNAGYVTGWMAALLERRQEHEEGKRTTEQKGDGDGPHLLHGPC